MQRAAADRFARALERATTDWQRSLMQEWFKRNPEPLCFGNARAPLDRLNFIVPTACTCLECGSPSVIMPCQEIEPARGFVLCPNCSVPKAAEARA